MADRALSIIFLIATGALLIGARFDMSWAGGQGYDTSRSIAVRAAQGAAAIDRVGMERAAAPGQRIARGEFVRTGADGYRTIEIEGVATVGLAERTDLLIQKFEADRITLFLKRGRIMVQMAKTDAKLTVATKHTQITLRTGAASIINYDFKETVEIAPIQTTAAITTGDRAFVAKEPVAIHETNPVTITDSQFDPATSAGAEFYRWFEEQTKPTDRPD